MQFAEWFSQQQSEGLTQAALAKRLDVTQGRVGQLISGDLPSFRLAMRIEEITGGKVRLSDWSREPQRASPVQKSEPVAP